MAYLITATISFLAGFVICWIYKNKVMATALKEKEAIKSSVAKF